MSPRVLVYYTMRLVMRLRHYYIITLLRTHDVKSIKHINTPHPSSSHLIAHRTEVVPPWRRTRDWREWSRGLSTALPCPPRVRTALSSVLRQRWLEGVKSVGLRQDLSGALLNVPCTRAFWGRGESTFEPCGKSRWLSFCWSLGWLLVITCISKMPCA